MQAAVNWWFANNLLFLWFGSIGLGTAYYMIPKVIGRPVLQLSSGHDRILDLRAILELDRNAAPGRWTISGLDDHGEHRGHNPNDHSSRHRRTESSHDDAAVIFR